MFKQAPRMELTAEERAKYHSQYTTEELLKLALNMLDSAAEKQRAGKSAFLHNNMTLEVIRDRVERS